MIVEWLLTIGANVGEWFAELFPDWTPPAFLVELDVTLNGVVDNLGGVGVWADWVYILAIVGFVIAAWLIGLTVKIARAVAAHIPLVGGAG